MGNLLSPRRVGDRSLQFSILNEEFLVSVIHQIALITSLPFVHTARRYYRLNGLVSSLDCCTPLETSVSIREGDQTWSFRGSKSRNKVSVGEPAEGSLPNPKHTHTKCAHYMLYASLLLSLRYCVCLCVWSLIRSARLEMLYVGFLWRFACGIVL